MHARPDVSVSANDDDALARLAVAEFRACTGYDGRPLAVAREASVRLIDEAMSGAKLIAVFTQRDASVEEPSEEDLYRIGTATHIHKMFKLPDGSLRLIVQGLARVRLERIVQMRPYLRGAVVAAEESLREEDHLEIDAGLTYLDNEPLGRVTAIPLYRERYRLLVAADAPLGDRQTVTWTEVAQVPVKGKSEPVATFVPRRTDRSRG